MGIVAFPIHIKPYDARKDLELFMTSLNLPERQVIFNFALLPYWSWCSGQNRDGARNIWHDRSQKAWSTASTTVDSLKTYCPTCLICKRDEYPLAGREWDKRARKNNTFIGRPLKAEDASAAEFGLEHIRRNLYVLLQSLQKDKEIQGSQWYV